MGRRRCPTQGLLSGSVTAPRLAAASGARYLSLLAMASNRSLADGKWLISADLYRKPFEFYVYPKHENENGYLNVLKETQQFNELLSTSTKYIDIEYRQTGQP